MAGGKGNQFNSDLLKLIFQAVGIPNLADNASSSPLTAVYVSLHTADPGVSGNQTTNEAAYAGYTRIAVPRTAAAWTVTGSVVNPVNPIVFPTATGGSETETWAVAGMAATGTGKILYRGPLTTTVAVVAGAVPQLATTSALTES